MSELDHFIDTSCAVYGRAYTARKALGGFPEVVECPCKTYADYGGSKFCQWCLGVSLIPARVMEAIKTWKEEAKRQAAKQPGVIQRYDPVSASGVVELTESKESIPFHVSCFWTNGPRGPREGDPVLVTFCQEGNMTVLEVRHV